MIEIKDLLIKFNKLIDKEEVKIFLIQEAIMEVINLKIDQKDIKFKNNILSLNIKPIYKSEIFLKKDQILKRIEEKSNLRNITHLF